MDWRMNLDPLNNKPISPKEFRIKKILDIVVIILFTLATGFLIYEIKVVEEEGGQCVNNPMAWAEKHIYQKKGVLADCGCRISSINANLSGFNLTSQLNSTNNTKNG